MNYKVTFENNYVVEIKHKHVRFTIRKETDTLYELKNEGNPTNIVIPSIFPSGHKIRYLHSSSSGNMVQGIFNTITISDGIIVENKAFQNAEVKKVVWNDCSHIPKSCFYGSWVTEVANIANIEEIMEYAFAFSNITTFNWPTGCKKIPPFCFANSMLTEINNIDGVTTVGELAFADTNVMTLDLSGTNIVYIAPKALEDLPDDCNLILPYYVSSENFANAIGHVK